MSALLVCPMLWFGRLALLLGPALLLVLALLLGLLSRQLAQCRCLMR